MAQFSKGDTFTDGEQVTGARLNQLIDSATLLAGAITDQSNITANTVATGDSILLYDLSATALREANVSDVLGSNLPITTSAITAGINSDIVITPNDGTIVTGQAYTSGDGQTVTVTSTAHTLTVGQVILVTAATATDYNGTFRVTTVATNSFTYVIFPSVTAGSGTLSYTKKGLVKNPANKSIAGNLYVDGTMEVNSSAKFSQSVLASGAFTSNGTANFTGTLQVNGTVGYALTEVAEETITTYTTASLPASWTTAWTSASYVKPAGEIWVIESCFNWQRNVAPHCAIRLRQTSSSTDLFGLFDVEGAGSVYTHPEQAVFKYVVPASTTFTSTFTMDAIASTAGYSFELGCTTHGTAGVLTGVTIPVSKFRIYKYKTA